MSRQGCISTDYMAYCCLYFYAKMIELVHIYYHMTGQSFIKSIRIVLSEVKDFFQSVFPGNVRILGVDPRILDNWA